MVTTDIIKAMRRDGILVICGNEQGIDHVESYPFDAEETGIGELVEMCFWCEVFHVEGDSITLVDKYENGERVKIEDEHIEDVREDKVTTPRIGVPNQDAIDDVRKYLDNLIK